MVCGEKRGWSAMMGEGVVKELCACMQAHADVRQCAVLASQRGSAPLSHMHIEFHMQGNGSAAQLSRQVPVLNGSGTASASIF